ncbi:MAG: lytic transglycosylase domain-containing protein [Rhizobiaceae bacterium]|nr:lytic transglycosylase domain-containing protein [Rhizobiaceae bacterium]
MAGRARSMVLAAAALAAISGSAAAAECGKTGSGFDTWKQSFAQEAAAQGVGKRGLSALAGASYANATINADRNQKSFKLSFDAFMKKRGASTIISKGKQMKRSNAALFANIERRYGVPAGPLIAIWGMETGFGGYMGKQNTISAITTLAYDCRRPDYFKPHAIAALVLVDRGTLTSSSVGAMHGEVGHTQFLPGNVLRYGVDGDGNGSVDLRNKADALASTANFLRGHGWQPGAGYQPGQPNFGAIQGWNAASVYQRAIAEIGAAIDGG